MNNLDEYALRKQKRDQLHEQGTNPYPATATRTVCVDEYLNNFSELEKQQKVQTLVGRIRLLRSHGKIIFCQLQDRTGTMQIVLTKDDIGEDHFTFFKEYFDVGDFIQATGTPFVTKKGEQSLLASEVLLLSKALRPLPAKWHGLQDEEARHRLRYLDILFDPELKDLFKKKSAFWNAMRNFLVDEGFIEVETPVLELTPGGADAQPFITHHNALDIDVYLRISMGELWQKRLMVAGFEKTFEIGRQFRNEGVSPEHLQDYTQMEFYWAYADYREGMKLVERLYKHCMQEAFGTLQFEIKGQQIDFGQEWGTIDYCSEIQQQLDIDVTEASEMELAKKCKELHISVDSSAQRGRLIDSLWKHCRKQIAGPAFLINHPVEVSPLSKRKIDNPKVVERFQVIAAGSELGNGYSELNDPVDQEQRFEEQAKMREAGDVEAQMHDADFVEALEYGMPPTCGFGVSERLFSFLADKSIRECVVFPLLRPKTKEDNDE